MKYIIALLIVIVITPANAFYDSVEIGVRAKGMGGAQVAVGGDVSSALFNAALLSKLTNTTIAAFYGLDYNGLDLGKVGSYWLGVGIPLTKFGAAASWYNRGSGIDNTDLFSENLLHLALSAEVYDNIVLGLGIRNYGTSWSGKGPADMTDKASGMDIDFGVLMEFQDGFTMGISALNLLATDLGYQVESPLPRSFKVGFSYLLNKYHDDLLAADVNLVDGDMGIHAGYETWRNKDKSVGLRLGIASGTNAAMDATMGLTIKHFPIQVDYAFAMPFGAIETRMGQHLFALSYKHGLPPPIEYEEPPKQYKQPPQKIKPKRDITHSVSLIIPQAALSPNGDGYLDVLAVTAIVEFNQVVDGWSFSIYDKKNNIIKQIAGSGPVPTSITWDGRDNFSRTVPDGIYYANIEAYYQDGFKAISEVVEISVLNEVSNIHISANPDYLIVGDFQGFDFSEGIKFHFTGALESVNHWTLTITNKLSGDRVQEFSEQGALPATLVWDGATGSIKEGEYKVRLVIQDIVGNHGPIENDLTLTVITSLAQSSAGLEITHGEIQYDKQSGKLYATSLPALDKVGKVMAKLPDYAFNINTFAASEAEAIAYANAISEYLNRNFDIERARLYVNGKSGTAQLVKFMVISKSQGEE